MNYLKWVIIIIASSAVIIALAFGIKYFKTSKQNTPFPTPSSPPPTSFPTPIPGSLNLESCDIKKEGNPLLTAAPEKLSLGSSEVIAGTFRGNINKIIVVTVEPSQTYALELISPQGDQIHTFILQEEKGLVYDSVNLKDLTLKDITLGQTVVISFNCFLEDKRFKITRVAIES